MRHTAAELAVIGRKFVESRTRERGERRQQLGAARELCRSFGHSYLQSVSGGLCICVYCGRAVAPSAAALALTEVQQ